MSIELQVLSIELQVLSTKLQASSIELQVLSLELQVLSIELQVLSIGLQVGIIYNSKPELHHKEFGKNCLMIAIGTVVLGCFCYFIMMGAMFSTY